MADKYIDLGFNTDVASIPIKQCTAVITGISAAASAVVTAANDFSVGDRIAFSGVVGMTEINNLVGTISAASATSFTVNIDSSLFTTYTSGGVAGKQHYAHLQARLVYGEAVRKDELLSAVRRAQQKIIETMV